MRTAVTGGALVTLFLFGAQLALPEGWRPSDIAGDAAGSAERHEAQQKMAAKVEIERRVADGVAQANAKAQADLMALTAAVEERNKGLAGLSSAAAIADWACLAGQAIAANTQPSLGADWRRPEQNGWHESGQAVARATCGLGGTLRESVTQSQLDVVRTAAAARGISMTNGTIPASATMPPVPAPPTAVAAVPHRDWSDTQRAQLVAYAHHQSDAVRVQFVEGIDTAHYGLTPKWYDRVAAYRYDHPEN